MYILFLLQLSTSNCYPKAVLSMPTFCLDEIIFADKRSQYVSRVRFFLPLVGCLRSTRCHGGSRVLCCERELLLSMLEHLSAEDPVSEAIDFVLLLVAETARGLHKNGEGSLFSSILYKALGFACEAVRATTYVASRRDLGDRIKNSLHEASVVVPRNFVKRDRVAGREGQFNPLFEDDKPEGKSSNYTGCFLYKAIRTKLSNNCRYTIIIFVHYSNFCHITAKKSA